MEQQANLPDVQVVLSIVADLGSSSASVKGTCQYEDAEDYDDEGPKDGTEVFDVSCFLQDKA